MAITVTLVEATSNRLRYLAVQDGAAGVAFTIPNDAGVSPDLQTDIAGAQGAAGPLTQIINVRTRGFPPLPAAAINQAQARALLASDDAAGAVLTNANVGRCRLSVTPRDAAAAWGVDANVDGGGDPVIDVTSGAAASSAYIDLEFSPPAGL